MKPMFSVTILWWAFILIDVRAYPDCCVVRNVEEGASVACRRCGLDALPQDLPINTTQLDLTGNHLTVLQPNSFLSLPVLQSLTLNENGLRNITSGAFGGLGKLNYLDLRHNRLDNSLDTDAFKFLDNLRVLDLRWNVFHHNKVYPVNSLSHITSIETLYIDIFEEFSFRVGFSHLKKLKILYLEGIHRCSIRNSSFIGLQSLGITQLTIISRIHFIEKDALSSFKRLTFLEINSHKSVGIREVLQSLYGLRNRTMELIYFRRNYFPFENPIELQVTDILYLKSICLKRLYLIRNSISSINVDVVKSWTSKKCLEVLDISENKFVNIAFFLSLPLFNSLTHFSLTNNIQIKSRRKRFSLTLFANSQLVFILPPRLVFLNLSNNNVFGDFTHIHFPSNNSLRYFDISYQRKGNFWFDLNVTGLVHLQELYISYMSCPHVNCVTFDAMPNIAKVVARKCYLENDFLTIKSKSVFNGLHNLTYIDLSENHILKWDSMTFYDQKGSLKELRISENKIDTFPAEALEPLETLKYVDISQNAISTLTASDCIVLDKLKEKSKTFRVNLHGNPLICSCQDLEFLRWVIRTTTLFNKQDLQCYTPSGDSIHFKELHHNFERFEINCASFSWLLVSIILIILTTLLVIFSLVAWRYSARLRVWCRQPLEWDFKHHVFLSYSAKDSRWVREHLVPHLEQDQLSFTCEDKDFKPGKDIATNILDAIDYSYKSVFVVSYNFLNCEWTKYAMQVASGYCFRKGREEMNIVILLDDIELSELPKLLRKKWDYVKCLRWPADDIEDDGSFHGRAGDSTPIELERTKVLEKLSKYVRMGNPNIVQEDDAFVKETVM